MDYLKAILISKFTNSNFHKIESLISYQYIAKVLINEENLIYCYALKMDENDKFYITKQDTDFKSDEEVMDYYNLKNYTAVYQIDCESIQEALMYLGSYRYEMDYKVKYIRDSKTFEIPTQALSPIFINEFVKILSAIPKIII